MPEKTPTPIYVGGDDPAIVEKRRAYEEALDRLSRSLETRQQRMFDPALLGAAVELLSPGKTGSFFEAAGRAAGAYGKGQEGLIKEEQDIARSKLETAQMGLELERQRQSDIQLENFLKGRGAPSAAPAGAQPSGPLSQVGNYGYQIAPPDPNAITGDEFIQMNRGVMPMRELLQKAADIDAKNRVHTEKGVIDKARGIMYPYMETGVVTRMIRDENGVPKKVEMSAIDAAELDRAELAKDPVKYAEVRARIQGGGPLAPTPKPPEVAAPPLQSVGEREIEQERKKEQAVGREKLALEQEKGLPARTAAARVGYQAAADTEAILKRAAREGRNPTGLFDNVGFTSAILGAVQEGLTVGNGKIAIPQLETAISKIPGIGTQQDLRDRKAIARNSAQLVLAFRKQYYEGQGAVSNAESQAVIPLAGSELDSMANLLRVSGLLKARNQFDLDEARKWTEFKRENPGANYTDFTDSKPYLRRLDDYDRKIAKMFGFEPSVPTEQKTPQKTGTSKFTPEQIEAARKRLLGKGER